MKNPIRLILCALLLSDGIGRAQTTIIHDVREFGAKGDGTTLNTKALQAAIDKSSAAGGGTVLVKEGRYVTGTFYLKSDVTLRVEAGATLLGSPNIADYPADTDRTMYGGEPYMDRCLFFANGVRNLTIEGTGTIDGQGKSFPNKGDRGKNRPKMFRLLYSSNIRIRNITLTAPASWTTEFRYCHDIDVRGITIASRNISNGDGLDFDGCTKVRVDRCKFSTGDDSICLQTSLVERPCRDVVITNCGFTARWAAIRVGLLSRGDISDLLVSDCILENHNDTGLKIQNNEGAEMSNLIFRNIVMKNVARPVFLTFTQKNAWVDAPRGELPPMKRMRDIRFENFTVDSNNGKHSAFVVTGVPGHQVEDVTFIDIKAVFHGTGSKEDAKTALAELTPENLFDAQGRGRWPEYGLMRGVVPARGLYARHVKGITLRNVSFGTRLPDARPAVVFVDVSGSKVSVAPTPDQR